MHTLAVLLPVLLVLLMAVAQIRSDARQGAAVNWTKTLATLLGALLVTALALAALLWLASVDRLSGGLLLFGLVLFGGLTALSFGVKRQWPDSR